ncbi:MAG: NAD-dependent epimerase/dehydratase family protein [Phycisphaerales bacterium]
MTTPSDVSRRHFLLTASSLAAMTATFSSSSTTAWSAHAPRPQAREPLTMLILGGTRFLGPALVQNAVMRGHTVVLFNRGKSNPRLFPDLEKLIGDRDPDVGEGLNALQDRSFDIIIDTSGYIPRHARASARLLAPAIKQYIFISTLSVYADQSKTGLVESDALAVLPADVATQEEVSAETYGPLKALCEQAIEEEMAGKTTIVRPGLIVGPEDATDRFTYWPVRVERGGEVLAPGDRDDPIQYIDVRDLAAFCIHAAEERTTGSYNATGPRGVMTIAELVHGCKAVTGGDVRFTWPGAAFLSEHNVQPWSEMPVWLPPGSPAAGLCTASNSKAVARGLTFRPLAATVRDTLDWYRSLPPERQAELRAGITPEREAEVLAAFHATAEAR